MNKYRNIRESDLYVGNLIIFSVGKTNKKDIERIKKYNNLNSNIKRIIDDFGIIIDVKPNFVKIKWVGPWVFWYSKQEIFIHYKVMSEERKK